MGDSVRKPQQTLPAHSLQETINTVSVARIKNLLKAEIYNRRGKITPGGCFKMKRPADPYSRGINNRMIKGGPPRIFLNVSRRRGGRHLQPSWLFPVGRSCWLRPAWLWLGVPPAARVEWATQEVCAHPWGCCRQILRWWVVVVERATQGVFVVALALALRYCAVPSLQQAALTRASCVRLSRLVLLVLRSHPARLSRS